MWWEGDVFVAAVMWAVADDDLSLTVSDINWTNSEATFPRSAWNQITTREKRSGQSGQLKRERELVRCQWTRKAGRC